MPTSRRGRKIDTIELKHEGVVTKVALYMRSEDTGINFYAEIPELDIRESGSNVNEVRDNLYKAYREKAGITWTPYLHIVFGGRIRRLIVEKNNDEEEN